MSRTLLVALLLLVLAACGGQEDGAATADPTTGPTVEATDEPAAGATSEPALSDAEDHADHSDEEHADDLAGASPECVAAGDALREAGRAYGDLAGAAMAGEAIDAEAIEAGLQAMVDAVPAELRADFEILAAEQLAFIAEVRDQGLSGDVQSADDLEELLAMTEAHMTSEEMQAASDRIETWYTTRCGG